MLQPTSYGLKWLVVKLPTVEVEELHINQSDVRLRDLYDASYERYYQPEKADYVSRVTL